MTILETLERLHKEATPGAWIGSTTTHRVLEGYDAELLHAMFKHLPKLLRVARAAEKPKLMAPDDPWVAVPKQWVNELDAAFANLNETGA